jgi:SAM-dependent methyltransferase
VEDVLPWALEGLELGENTLEIGPGYGAASEVLAARTGSLTCVELDGVLARTLARRTAGAKVRVVQADAMSLPFAAESFSAAVCFTMIHHIPNLVQQNCLLAEVARVLRPTGTFAGTDSYAGFLFRMIHAGDNFTPVDPQALPQRLKAAGFAGISVDRRARDFRFRARRSSFG